MSVLLIRNYNFTKITLINYNPDKLMEGESIKLNWRGTRWIQKRDEKLEVCVIKNGRPICKVRKLNDEHLS